jgi:hypothetical protein
MRINIATLFIAAVLGCNLSSEALTEAMNSAASGAAASGNAPAASDPKPAKPLELDAVALFKDYKSLEGKGLELMTRYEHGVIVNGKIKKTIVEQDKSTRVWLDAGDGKWIDLGFTDQGAAVAAKKVKIGDELKAKCTVGGQVDNFMQMMDCELK